MNSDMFIFKICFDTGILETAKSKPTFVSRLGKNPNNLVRFVKHCLFEASLIQRKKDFCRASGLSLTHYDRFLQLRDLHRAASGTEETERTENINIFKKPLQKDKEIDIVCEHCNKSFSTKSKLIRRTVNHTGEHLFTCEFCGKGLDKRSLFRRHLIRHTKEESLSSAHIEAVNNMDVVKKPYGKDKSIDLDCVYCGKIFLTKSKLVRHTVKHTEIKPFNCEVCGKEFNEKYLLKKHKITHNDKDI